jgi:hypothetical protein
MPTKPSVFISYRRNPSSEFARYIRRELSDAGVSVFLDVENITKGRFENVISDGIEKADSFLLILAPETLKSEWVQKEVKLALDLGKNIVPLLMPDFRMEEHVPEEMTALRRLHGIPYNHHYAEAALDKVKTALGVTQEPITVAVRRFSLPMAMAVIALLVVIVGILLLSQQDTGSTTLLDPTATPSSTLMDTLLTTPTNAPTQFITQDTTAVAIVNFSMTQTEALLQRTADVVEHTNVALLAENTQIAATAQAQRTNTPFIPPNTTATQVINFSATQTEAILQRTADVLEQTSKAMLVENTQISETATARAIPTMTNTPSSTPTAIEPTVTITPTFSPTQTYIPTPFPSTTFDATHTEGSNLSFPTANLIQNPGAEMELEDGRIPSWIEGVGTTWTRRPTTDDNAPYQGNFYFFAGEAARAELYQDMDVSFWADIIDKSNLSFKLDGYVYSDDQSPPDRARIILEFRDANSLVLWYFDTGWTNSRASWQQISRTSIVPLGTRTIRIRLLSMRYSGENNDGYFDELSLVVTTSS